MRIWREARYAGKDIPPHETPMETMVFDTANNLRIRRLNMHDQIPYDLLLLADETIEAIDKYIKTSEIYVIELKDKVIAVYVLQVVDKDIMEIKNIAVDKDHQGQGIGKFLLIDATEKAMGRGFKAITIGTGDAARKQLALYQKAGFKIFKIKKNFFPDNYPEPIYENGILLKDMIMLKKDFK